MTAPVRSDALSRPLRRPLSPSLQALANLRANAAKNGVAADALRVAEWDASRGPEAVRSAEAARVFVPRHLTHIIGADVVYHGGAAGLDDSTSSAPVGLAATLAALLEASPNAAVTLLLVDRFSGGAVSAVAGQAGVAHSAATEDPALAAFRSHCTSLGLTVRVSDVPDAVVRRVAASQPPWTRAVWWISDRWDGLRVYTIER